MSNKMHAVYIVGPLTVVLVDTGNKTVEKVDPAMVHKAYPSKRDDQQDETLKTAAKKTKTDEETAKSKSEKKGHQK